MIEDSVADHSRSCADSLRVVANSTMWQSEEWKRVLVNVYSEDELAGRTQKSSDFVTAWRLFRRPRRAMSFRPREAEWRSGMLCSRGSCFAEGPRALFASSSCLNHSLIQGNGD